MSLTKAKYGIVTPATLTADANNYNFVGLSVANLIRLSSNASRNITGLSTQGLRLDRPIAVTNVGAQNIVLKHQSGSSDAANRFNLGQDVTLAPGQSAMLFYDILQSRWIALAGATGAVAGSGASPISGGSLNVGAGATAYYPLNSIAATGAGSAAQDPTDLANATVQDAWIAPAAGTLSDLYTYANSAPGAGESRTAEIVINGVVSPISLTYGEADTSKNDLVNSAAVAAGDRVAIKFVASGGAAGTAFAWGVKFVAS